MSSEKRKKRLKDNWMSVQDVLSSSCSQAECTGLVPAGGDMTEDEFEGYQDIFPFSVPEK